MKCLCKLPNAHVQQVAYMYKCLICRRHIKNFFIFCCQTKNKIDSCMLRAICYYFIMLETFESLCFPVFKPINKIQFRKLKKVACLKLMVLKFNSFSEYMNKKIKNALFTLDNLHKVKCS